eukprot:TRINITY_DN38773_c0_g1_i1.p1 TRINITY_DN38773_c0_g1~~TRINITY_DN38773_c0_g1_i1.p1  ORF type:complete len:297 (-),score=58.88 TRINITY_DN38773_c0_g1_i1:129-1019(-)
MSVVQPVNTFTRRCVNFGFGRLQWRRPFSSQAKPSKPIFFDMVHSNNAARIRLWLRLKEGVGDAIERRVVTYPDLQSAEFAAVNPLKKVPGYIREDGSTVFESNVILGYLEDKYRSKSPSFTPGDPEGRQVMELFIRIHDLYIASPNCTAPGFSHSQGAMYLSYGFHGEARGMDLKTRAAKVAEIWKQLNWLNDHLVGPYLIGDKVTLADFTWYPTTIFMEFMLPRVFGWPNIFSTGESPLPKLAAWWEHLTSQPAFAEVRNDIFTYWVELEKQGQFKHIIDEIANDKDGLKFKYP